MDLATAYISRQRALENANGISFLLKAFQKMKAGDDLDVDEETELADLIKKAGHQPRSLVEVYQAQLWKAWKNFSPPETTLEMAISEIETVKVGALKKRYQLKSEGSKEAEKNTIMADRDFADVVWEKDGCFFRVDPTDGENNKTQLIEYYKAVKYEEFEKTIIKNPDSGNLDLHRTLIGIIDECQRRGFNRKQLCFVLKELVRHEIKTSYSTVIYITDANDLFSALLGLLDYSSHLTSLRAQMKKVQRKPTEGITVPLEKFKSIVAELLGIQSPDSDAAKNKTVVEKETMRAIKYFVTPGVWDGIQAFKELYKENNQGAFASLQEVIDFVNDSERKAENRPDRVLSTENKSIKIDLFYSDTMYSWQLGTDDPEPALGDDEEDDYEYEEGEEETVLISEGEYQNWPPKSSSDESIAAASAPRAEPARMRSQGTIPKDQKALHRMFNNESLEKKRKKEGSIQSSRGRGGYQGSRGGGQSAGRGGQASERSARAPTSSANRSQPPPTHSPNSRRARTYVRSPSGAYRSVSRDRMYNVNDQGNMVPRPRSNSPYSRTSTTPSKPKPRGPSPSMCPRCWQSTSGTHAPGACVYRNFPITETVCPVCKSGFHSGENCVHKNSGQRPSSPNSSKFMDGFSKMGN